jgi:glutamine kinase
MKWRYGSKAETLEFLRGKISTAVVLPHHFFSVAEWRRNPQRVIGDLRARRWVEEAALAVRSSSASEDTEFESAAGRYESVLDVGKASLADAIDRVIASYGGSLKHADQVLIQPMVEDIRASGVVTSCEPGTGRPYAIASWSDESDPRAVTGGSAHVTKRWFWSRAAPERPTHQPIRSIIALLEEVESILAWPDLDIEFAFDAARLVLLQARPLACLPARRVANPTMKRQLRRAQQFIEDAQKRHPSVFGQTTYFSVMTDWNPAEMIGRRPDPLALSLYRELITERTWADQRYDYGYRDLRGFPLMVTIAGQPFIDVRLSLNSFVPSTLREAIAERLVELWLARLRRNPSQHDKVEFEIVLSANSFDLPRRLADYRKRGFTAADCGEIEVSLRDLTNRMMEPGGVWHRDLEDVALLATRRQELLASDMTDIAKICWLLRDCSRYGTRPFAGLARAAFVAVKILKSMVDKGLISDEQSHRVFANLNGASGDLIRDRESLTRDEFLRRHGHLRPGTYIITRNRYDEAVNSYFNNTDPGHGRRNGGGDPHASNHASPLERPTPRVFDRHVASRVDKALAERGFQTDAAGLEQFLHRAIGARERSKWEFSKNVSEALVLIERLGHRLGFTRDECSFFTLRDFEDIYTTATDPRAVLRRAVTIGRRRERIGSAVMLPALIFDPTQVWSFPGAESEPTFVTNNVVSAPPVLEPMTHQSVVGRIALIRAADPGYDWIFCHGVVGLITAYGGTNSHMAIRAAELSVPAVLGVGEERLAEWAKAEQLQIDCRNHSVRVPT